MQEEQFANEFLQRDGLHELIDVINTSHGNILAVSISQVALRERFSDIAYSTL